MATASKSIEQRRKGMNRTRRRSTTASGAPGQIQITLPMNADCMIIENVGTVDINFVFGSDTFGNHWALKPGERSPEFAVNQNTVVEVRSIGAIGDIQYMLWG